MNTPEPGRIYLVVSILKTTATLWLDGVLIEAWDYKTGANQSRQYGWLMTFEIAKEEGIVIA